MLIVIEMTAPAWGGGGEYHLGGPNQSGNVYKVSGTTVVVDMRDAPQFEQWGFTRTGSPTES